MLVKIEVFFDRFADALGNLTAVIMIAMLLNVFYDVIMRYLFRSGSIALQEMEWHLFAIVFLIGISYSFLKDGHVRVDIIYDHLSVKKQVLINIIGSVIFLIPFCLLIAFGSIGFVQEAYFSGEISGDPGGLTHRWLIKSLIPFSFYLLAFVTTGFIVKNINLYRSADVNEQKENV